MSPIGVKSTEGEELERIAVLVNNFLQALQWEAGLMEHDRASTLANEVFSRIDNLKIDDMVRKTMLEGSPNELKSYFLECLKRPVVHVI